MYRPPGPYTDFLKEFADFLSDLLVNVDKALIVGDFNIHVDNTNDALGLSFTDLINSFGVKQNVTGPTHRFNHTLDFIISHGIELTDIDIVPQSDDVTDHILVSCMLHRAVVKSTFVESKTSPSPKRFESESRPSPKRFESESRPSPKRFESKSKSK